MGAESIFLLGLFMGMTHAFEADHIAAVANISSEQNSKNLAVRYGIYWALGHGAIIALIYLISLALGSEWTASLSHYAEMVVAAVLIAMGAHILYRLYRDRVHFHAHRHDEETLHFHAHSHQRQDLTAAGHASSVHMHQHRMTGVTALVVGSLHGLAGSAALLIAMSAVITQWSTSLLFLLLFIVGSAVGMAALSAAVSLPFAIGSSTMTVFYRALRLGMAAMSVSIGVYMFRSLI